ncbi:MAG: hypothetical protein AMDU1_APLC00017G0010 [Thermoplasmatales archaeon A-plasma]|jgi:uncharacterized protein YdhG (YjbR/CyaY superfamily)|nr:MAG: hypothetical protein AMDU1_APLC00017G0010 [Thermoplasmatales archaeon A-plasma]WMT45512.1 MAG: hypothetical protein RE469_04775 [Cuniculiplasma divulgatum]
MAKKDKVNAGFTDEEKLAMAERAKELASIRKKVSKPNLEDSEKEVLLKFSEMGEPDRTIATNLHALIKEIDARLTPRTWYGMPAYEKNGSVLLFFQERRKFKTRYATVGFSGKANLDNGTIWPNAFAVVEWNYEVCKRLKELITIAIS